MTTSPNLDNALVLRPRPPFRLDLTVWALRRRDRNRLDCWDGGTYRHIRSYPGSRHNPQFGKEEMERWVPDSGLAYTWMRDCRRRRHGVRPIRS